jgi:hypothetical protein
MTSSAFLTPIIPWEDHKHVAKVRRINGRWIVRGHLRQNAAAYMDYLEKVDPLRLEKSCELAMDLVQRKQTIRDPKPLFYAGLFSMATREEISLYLGEHAMTRAICLLIHGETSGQHRLEGDARRLAAMIAAEISDAMWLTASE